MLSSSQVEPKDRDTATRTEYSVPADRGSKGQDLTSLVAAGISIVGDVTGEGTIRIDGVVEGTLNCRTVVISETGTVDGKIKADTVTISGRFKGKAHCRDITLTATADANGELAVGGTLVIEPRAGFEGRCRRLGGNSGKSRGSNTPQE